MRCLKAFGERIAARDPDRQTAEFHILVAPISRFNALGTAEVVIITIARRLIIIANTILKTGETWRS